MCYESEKHNNNKAGWIVFLLTCAAVAATVLLSAIGVI